MTQGWFLGLKKEIALCEEYTSVRNVPRLTESDLKSKNPGAPNVEWGKSESILIFT